MAGYYAARAGPAQRNKDGRGARGDDLPRGARGRVVVLSSVSCTPPPTGAGGTGKTGAASQRGLYVTIHSLSRALGNFLPASGIGGSVLERSNFLQLFEDFTATVPPGARSAGKLIAMGDTRSNALEELPGKVASVW